MTRVEQHYKLMQMLKRNTALFTKASQAANKNRSTVDDRKTIAAATAAATSSTQSIESASDRSNIQDEDGGEPEAGADGDALILGTR